jgi:hypothetical protein
LYAADTGINCFGLQQQASNDMSELEIKGHPIWAQLNQIQQWEQAASFADPNIFTNEQFRFARDKIFASTKWMLSMLESTPFVLISLNGLNQIQSNFQYCLNEVSNFVANNNAAHLVNAANHIDTSVMPSVWAFFPRNADVGTKLTNEIISQIRESSAKTIASIDTQKNALKAEVEQLHTEISKERSAAQQLSETLNSQKNEALAVNARMQQEFAEAEIRRTEAFNQKLAEINAAAKLAREKFSTTAKLSLDALSKNEEDAKRIVQVVGNIGTTANFQKIAKDEADQANLWRWITVGLFAVGICVAVFTFFKFLDAEPTPEHAWTAAIRLLYAIAVAAPAWYAAKESARHRTNSDSAKRTELELASLGPFIELMPDDKKISIREGLVQKYFGNSVKPHEIEPAGEDLKDFALEAIKAMKK